MFFKVFDNFRAISSPKPELATPPEVCHHVRRLGRHFIQLDGREPRENCLPGAVRGPAPYPDWVGCHGQKVSTAKTESPTVALLSFCKTSRVQHTPIRSCRKRDVRGIQGLQSTRERRITQIVCRSLRGRGGSGSHASSPVTHRVAVTRRCAGRNWGREPAHAPGTQTLARPVEAAASASPFAVRIRLLARKPP